VSDDGVSTGSTDGVSTGSTDGVSTGSTDGVSTGSTDADSTDGVSTGSTDGVSTDADSTDADSTDADSTDDSLVEEGALGARHETPEPLLRVLRGDPSPEEVAALVAVIASLGGPADAPPRRTPVWNAPGRLVRVTHRHGPGAWRASGLPR
jgi:hypothetical protein